MVYKNVMHGLPERCAVIDVGSNTIRLSAGTVSTAGAETHFSKKITAGLAGFVRDGVMSTEGIDAACDALIELRASLDFLNIDDARAFATAAIRNAANSETVVKKIKKRTGFELEVLSGEEEALMGFRGVRGEIQAQKGALLDIGGGSTEITAFTGSDTIYARSFPIGSLSLFTKCVKRSLVPSKQERRGMTQMMNKVFGTGALDGFPKSREIYAVGGSARAALLLAIRAFGMKDGERSIEAPRLRDLRDMLLKGDHASTVLILKNCPDRVHTIIPGVTILCSLMRRLGGRRLTVCRGGVREGYMLTHFRHLTR